jgi:hypothetical protein
MYIMFVQKYSGIAVLTVTLILTLITVSTAVTKQFCISIVYIYPMSTFLHEISKKRNVAFMYKQHYSKLVSSNSMFTVRPTG